MEKKIRFVKMLHRVCVCAAAVAMYFNSRFIFDGMFHENDSFFAKLGLWVIVSLTMTSPLLGGVSFIVHTVAFYKDTRERKNTTFKSRWLWGKTYYPTEIDDEISAGMRFAIIIGYIVAGILIFA